MDAAQIRDLMDGVYPHVRYDRANSLIAGLSILRAFGEVDIAADHEEIFAHVNSDNVVEANLMGGDVLRALAALGWGFSTDAEAFRLFI